MTSEFLLDAMGLIDDDLIQDAEVRSAPVIFLQTRVRRWGSLAACLALVLTLGYFFLHMGGMNRSASTAASNTASSPSTAAGSGHPAATTESAADSVSGAASGASPSAAQDAGVAALLVDGNTYRLTGEFLDALPENSRSLGTLAAQHDGQAPAEYEGCALWTDDPDGIPAVVYVQLSEQRYAAAKLVQP